MGRGGGPLPATGVPDRPPLSARVRAETATDDRVSLLSVVTRGRESASLGTYMKVSRNQHVPLRIDEAGSVSCGGVAGISNTFASALWATGYITQVMASGAIGINLQGNPGNCAGYTPRACARPGGAGKGRAARPAGLVRDASSPDRSSATPTAHHRPGRRIAAASEGDACPGRIARRRRSEPSPIASGSESRRRLVLGSRPRGAGGARRRRTPGSRPLSLRLNVGAGLGLGQSCA